MSWMQIVERAANRIGELRPASSAPAAASAWQPIETAPGEESVLVSDGFYVEFGYRWDNRRPPVWTHDYDGTKLRPQPTHWMRVKPPQAQPSGVVPPEEQTT